MQASYRISEEDYAKAMKLFAKITPRLAILYGLSAIVLVTLALTDDSRVGAVILGALVCLIAIMVIARYITSPILTRRHYRKYKAMHQEFAVELLPDGIQFTSRDGSGKVRWENMHKWRQNDEFVLIYPMPRLFHIIPKSVAAQGFDLQGLTTGLLQHVGKPV